MWGGGRMEVWSKLPDDVVERIFSKLTVFDVLRAGFTCSRLRAFVSSHPSIFSSSLTLLLFSRCSLWAHDGGRDAWLKLSLSFLPLNLLDLPSPVASAGGLLCFGSGRDFIIFNPISRSWRQLPSVPHTVRMENKKRFRVCFDEDYMHAYGLMCDSITGTYDFFIVHQSLLRPEEFPRLMHYSSSLSQWRGSQPLTMSGSHTLYSDAIISCNSRLYTVWEKGSSFLVFAYSDNIWTKIECPDCTSAWDSESSLSNAFLMDVHGSLHMVGVVGAAWEGTTSMHIWKLHAESNEWMEVSRMPSSILQEFHSYIDYDEGLQCWGKNGVMYMKSSDSDVLMFDVGKIEWKWLKNTGITDGGLIFEPSLSASV